MLQIRPFEDHDYATTVSIHNASWPDQPTTEAERRDQDSRWDRQFLFQRAVGEWDGQPVAYCTVLEPFWSYRPGKYFIALSVHPDFRRRGIGMRLYDHARDMLAARDPRPQILISETREDQTGALAMLEKLGYEAVMRYNVSELRLDDFDPAPFAKSLARAEAAGITTHTLAELKHRYPDWLQRLYDLDWELWQDVPSTDPPKKQSIEVFETNLNANNMLPEAYFIALDGDTWVGVSFLITSEADQDRLFTGLTGVRRSHRRKGVATTLKLRAFDFARQYGAAIIRTDNEANNPMYALNMALGFKPVPSWVEFQKSLNGAE